METLISKESESNMLKLGLYQIIGGAVGLLLILWRIYKTPLLTGLTVLVYLVIILFFYFSIFCGTLCLKTNKNALKYSLINQILQVVGFAMMGFAFKYVAGVYLAIDLDLTNSINFGLSAGISKFECNINLEKERLEVNFNLISFALIYWIDKLMNNVKDEITLRTISSIGKL